MTDAPLTPEEIRAAIMALMMRAEDTTSHTAPRHKAKIGGLLIALTGKDGPTANRQQPFLDQAQIPYTVENGDPVIADEWLKAHGFVERADDDWHHPRFSKLR
jgi:hypothetical protein